MIVVALQPATVQFTAPRRGAQRWCRAATQLQCPQRQPGITRSSTTRQWQQPMASGAPAAGGAAPAPQQPGAAGRRPRPVAALAGSSQQQQQRTLADVIVWTVNLPWQRWGCWLVVALLVSQLKDFFGVSPACGSSCVAPRGWALFAFSPSWCA